jgi:hypothetical protein
MNDVSRSLDRLHRAVINLGRRDLLAAHLNLDKLSRLLHGDVVTHEPSRMLSYTLRASGQLQTLAPRQATGWQARASQHKLGQRCHANDRYAMTEIVRYNDLCADYGGPVQRLLTIGETQSGDPAEWLDYAVEFGIGELSRLACDRRVNGGDANDRAVWAPLGLGETPG